MSAMFHPKCGKCVVLLNGNRSAYRINPTQEFNRGLIFSLEPMKDNELFEVKIDKKVNLIFCVCHIYHCFYWVLEYLFKFNINN